MTDTPKPPRIPSAREMFTQLDPEEEAEYRRVKRIMQDVQAGRTPAPSNQSLARQQEAFIAAMTKATNDGLRPAIVAAAEANYVAAWSKQPWWWRKLHWKMKPSRNGVEGK